MSGLPSTQTNCVSIATMKSMKKNMRAQKGASGIRDTALG